MPVQVAVRLHREYPSLAPLPFFPRLPSQLHLNHLGPRVHVPSRLLPTVRGKARPHRSIVYVVPRSFVCAFPDLSMCHRLVLSSNPVLFVRHPIPLNLISMFPKVLLFRSCLRLPVSLVPNHSSNNPLEIRTPHRSLRPLQVIRAIDMYPWVLNRVCTRPRGQVLRPLAVRLSGTRRP